MAIKHHKNQEELEKDMLAVKAYIKKKFPDAEFLLFLENNVAGDDSFAILTHCGLGFAMHAILQILKHWKVPKDIANALGTAASDHRDVSRHVCKGPKGVGADWIDRFKVLLTDNDETKH